MLVGRCWCCFTSTRVSNLWGAFPCHWHFTVASQAHRDLHKLWVLPRLLCLLLPCLHHNLRLVPFRFVCWFAVFFLSRALRVWGSAFYPQVFFTFLLPLCVCPFQLTHGFEPIMFWLQIPLLSKCVSKLQNL